MSDPILVQRAKVKRVASLVARVGYLLWLISVIAFAIGMFTSFSDVAPVIIVTLIAGSVLLAPAIMTSYMVRAADRDDRERGL